ncbi:MAG: GNAT family N-acetyltransferase [Candidatus Bipolaricaulaceae bacterium]
MGGLRVRLATQEDRGRILAISQRIWEGQDYVPVVLDRWIAEGGLIVAEVSGQVVGFAKTTELAPGELWLEGLRVHPDHQGKGIAKALAQAQLERALAQKPRTIRLATVEENVASLHIARALGFKEVARFFYLEADVENRAFPSSLRPASFEEAWEFLRASPALVEAQGFVGLGWRFRALSPALLEEFKEAGAIFALGSPPQGLLLLTPDPYTPKEIASLVFLDGDEGALPLLLSGAHAWAASRGQKILAAMVAAPWLFTFLTRNGFQFVPELGAVLVLEYSRT